MDLLDELGLFDPVHIDLELLEEGLIENRRVRGLARV
jgi:hypothetical protein